MSGGEGGRAEGGGTSQTSHLLPVRVNCGGRASASLQSSTAERAFKYVVFSLSLPQIYLYRAASTHKVPAVIPFFAYSVLEFVERNFFFFFPSPPPLLVLGTFGSRRRRRRFLSLGYGQSAARLRGERAAADHSPLAAVTSVHSQVWESLHFSPHPNPPNHSPPNPNWMF